MTEQAGRLTVTPVHSHFGARVEGIHLPDLSKDDPAAKELFDELVALQQEYSVLVLPDQRFVDERQMEFTKEWYGPLETQVGTIGTEARLHPNLADWSNVDPEGNGKLLSWSDQRMIYQSGNQVWHSDSSYKPVPAKYSLLSAREVPPSGGETQFVSQRHGYETLPESLRRELDDRIVVHSLLYSRSIVAKGLFRPEQERAIPPTRQSLVRTNPVNGRKGLFIGAHAWYIEDMPYQESRALLDDLLARITTDDCVYEHRWTPGDLVIWDNRCVLHRGRTWDAARHRRVLRRTTVAGDGPTAEPTMATRTPEWDGIVPEGLGVEPAEVPTAAADEVSAR
ncbi:TauD/TfdA dioxygenase family protein [Actinophytocola sp.]|uniref:TauD/TfdA dioxygenase family protein n=1 Tax=Actinophytocola sp. TaxID=1872138 RepID=UPI00389AC2A1